MASDLEQKVINETFEGNKQAYDRAWSITTKDTINWSNVIDATSTAPQISQHALNLIAFHFGYLPQEHITFPYIPDLCSLIEDWKNNHIDYNKFILLSEQNLISLRNQIVFIHAEIEYPASTYEDYTLLPLEYKIKTKERLARILGYEPAQETSIQCELALSSVLSSDTNNLNHYLTEIDCQILLVIKYREVLLKDGKILADLSHLPIRQVKSLNNCYSDFTL